MKAICRHCNERNVSRPRGLCWTCYYAHGVRELYPSTSKFARRSYGNGFSQAPLPKKPTPYLPGTRRKLRVMARRAAKGYCLFHPLDGPR